MYIRSVLNYDKWNVKLDATFTEKIVIKNILEIDVQVINTFRHYTRINKQTYLVLYLIVRMFHVPHFRMSAVYIYIYIYI
jgi:hypothetical protein